MNSETQERAHTMLSPLTKEELAQYIALQYRVYLYAESIAEIYAGMSRGENLEAVRVEDNFVTVEATYSFDANERTAHYFPVDFLTKTLDEIRNIRAAEEKSVAAQKEIKEYEAYQRLKEKFEK